MYPTNSPYYHSQTYPPLTITSNPTSPTQKATTHVHLSFNIKNGVLLDIMLDLHVQSLICGNYLKVALQLELNRLCYYSTIK